MPNNGGPLIAITPPVCWWTIYQDTSLTNPGRIQSSVSVEVTVMAKAAKFAIRFGLGVLVLVFGFAVQRTQAENCSAYCGYGDTLTILYDCDPGSCRYTPLSNGECEVSGLNCSSGTWINNDASKWDLDIYINEYLVYTTRTLYIIED
jgi:hypothetical protein